jgi:hypothetical protein
LSFFKLIKKVFFLAASCLFLCFKAAEAQDLAHQNSVEIKREANSAISFNFALNLPTLLHRMLAPKTSYSAFLNAQIELSDQAFDRQIAQVSARLSDRAFLVLPSGTKLQLKQWQLPEHKILRNALVSSLILLNLPQTTNAHIDPMNVTSTVQSKQPISRAQLQLPAAMNPILVVFKADQFWLTDQIPSAIIELN